MPIKHILTIEIQFPADYPSEPPSKDIDSNLVRKAILLVDQQAKRLGMCRVETGPDSTLRLVLEEQCAFVPVTRAQESICEWATKQLDQAGTPETLPLVEDGFLKVPLRHISQAKAFRDQVLLYPAAQPEMHMASSYLRSAKVLAAKIETELRLEAK